MLTERRLLCLDEAIALFQECGIDAPRNVTYSMGVFHDNQIIATGSLSGDMIQGLAVSPNYQGEDLSAKVMTHLIDYALAHGITALYLFTKPMNAEKFISMGFSIVAIARPYAALLEWGGSCIKDYVERLIAIAKDDPGESTAIVMNCNPFTLGHLALIETAASRSRKVYVLVVEEDLSAFPFHARFDLIKKGVAHLSNVTLIPGSRYVVSSMTFPSYFTREKDLAAAQCAIDIEIFLNHIAPALGVTKRYVGTEPFSPVTEIYNQTMKDRLVPAGIEVIEIERTKQGDQAISASRVRRLLTENKMAEVRKMVPDATYDYLVSCEAEPVIRSLIGSSGYCEDA